MIWLGYDFGQAKDAEIGSRHEHSSRRQPIDAYIRKMREAAINVSRVLKPSKLAYFFIGDAVIDGQLHNMEEVYEEIVQDTGLRLIDTSAYGLESVSRSFHEKVSDGCHGGKKNGKKLQRILVFECVNIGKKKTARKKATPISKRRTQPLSNSVDNGSIVAIQSDDSDRHIHSLGRYPSRFIPEIPAWAIQNFSNEGDLVFDPFVGCGTLSANMTETPRPL